MYHHDAAACCVSCTTAQAPPALLAVTDESAAAARIAHAALGAKLAAYTRAKQLTAGLRARIAAAAGRERELQTRTEKARQQHAAAEATAEQVRAARAADVSARHQDAENERKCAAAATAREAWLGLKNAQELLRQLVGMPPNVQAAAVASERAATEAFEAAEREAVRLCRSADGVPEAEAGSSSVTSGGADRIEVCKAAYSKSQDAVREATRALHAANAALTALAQAAPAVTVATAGQEPGVAAADPADSCVKVYAEVLARARAAEEANTADKQQALDALPAAEADEKEARSRVEKTASRAGRKRTAADTSKAELAAAANAKLKEAQAAAEAAFAAAMTVRSDAIAAAAARDEDSRAWADIEAACRQVLDE
jgi:hypothetical protein